MKNGYKKTSLGILPSEWKIYGLKDIVEISKDKFNPINSKEQRCIELEHIEQNTGFLLGYTSSNLQKSTKNSFKKGQVLYGKLRPYLHKFYKAQFDGVCSTEIWVLKGKKISNDFLFYFVQSSKFNTIANITTGTKMPRADWDYMSEIPFLIPPLKEQRKIAEILSSYDEAILLTSNLISAKKEFKKALMQNLLTAKIRFPNFNGIWKEVKLGKFIKEQTIRNTKNINLVLSVTNKFGFVEQSNYFEKEVASKDTSNYKVIKNGNFAYNPSRINVGSIALLENFEVGILSPMYVIFDCLDGINKKFLKYWLQSHNFTGNLYKYLAGSVRETLNFKDMKNFKIKLPNLAEQTKIAEILSSVDDEIDLLNQKLEQLNLQKRGIIQNLLSGKVRVKI